MHILILGNPYETARALDYRRLKGQISACDRIIKNAMAGRIIHGFAFKNIWWLQLFCNTLDYYQRGMHKEAEEMSCLADKYRPSEFTDAMIQKNRHYLAKRDPVNYPQWA